ncbi:PQQ-binding-like beta-propeller repeat protein [Kribbella sp. NPDC049227]|uniref:outer membrane protein assembly factor BamB family protein n=1 Tax=Kribbella sp. NPDC049227 TaxID=3364113 RepID=UPI003711E2CF
MTGRFLRVRALCALAALVMTPLVAVGTAPASAVATGDWTQFRNGPAHQGVNTAETALSVSTVGGLRQQWVTKIGGSVWSSPATADGRVYVGGLDGRLHALDAATGQQLWAKPDSALTGDWTFTSPAIGNGVVYLGINRPAAEIWAFDAVTGATRWRTGASVSNINGSPVVAGGVVYAATTEDQVLALDAATGARIWDAKPNGGRGSGFYSSPTVAGGKVFAASLNQQVYALDAATGAVRWSFPTGGHNSSTPAVVDGTVYFGSRDGNVYAVDAETGVQRWKVRYGTNILASFQSSPAVVNGTVYIGTNNDRRVLALDAATGAIKWSFRTGGVVMSSPVVANGVVYVGSDDRSVYALRATNGQRLWSARLSGAVDSGPAVAQGKVYAGTYGDNGGGNVYSFALSR